MLGGLGMQGGRRGRVGAVGEDNVRSVSGKGVEWDPEAWLNGGMGDLEGKARVGVGRGGEGRVGGYK